MTGMTAHSLWSWEETSTSRRRSGSLARLDKVGLGPLFTVPNLTSFLWLVWVRIASGWTGETQQETKLQLNPAWSLPVMTMIPRRWRGRIRSFSAGVRGGRIQAVLETRSYLDTLAFRHASASLPPPLGLISLQILEGSRCLASLSSTVHCSCAHEVVSGHGPHRSVNAQDVTEEAVKLGITPSATAARHGRLQPSTQQQAT